MSKIVSIHSYRRGTGKSSLTINLAVLFAAARNHVALIDAALQSPSLHLPFNLHASESKYSLNDYLGGKCDIEQTMHDVTERLDADLPGKIFLSPADTKHDKLNFAQKKYPTERLEEGILKASESLGLDFVFIDTPAGIKDDALLSMAICDTLIEILRLDQQDYQGTAVVLDLARKLAIPQILLVGNFITKTYRPEVIKTELRQSYGFDVAALVPNSEEVLASTYEDVFVLTFPHHPITMALQQLTDRLRD